MAMLDLAFFTDSKRAHSVYKYTPLSKVKLLDWVLVGNELMSKNDVTPGARVVLIY